MLPLSSIDLEKTESEDNTKAFLIDFENKKIGGIIDGKEALMQAIKIALITPRYKYPVFSHNYGTDYKNAFEEGYVYGMEIVKDAICESLNCDNRIYDVSDFRFEKLRTGMKVRFNVRSIYGDIEYETEAK